MLYSHPQTATSRADNTVAGGCITDRLQLILLKIASNLTTQFDVYNCHYILTVEL
jgi:hypothetical protein